METRAAATFLARVAPALHILQVGTDTDHRPAVTTGSAGAEARCQHPDCGEPGLYRAPKSRARLHEYYWFCLAHVRAYNSAWDYCAGFKEADFEAQARAQACWERPTWRLGSWQSARLDAAMAGFAEAFGIEEGAEAGDNRSGRRQEQPPGAATDDKALAVLGLAPTATRAEIKARYKRLVKRYHPDANGGDRQAEERLKVINQAYSTLRKRPIAM